MNLPPIEERLANLLRRIAEEIRPCKACGTEIAMVMHNNRKLAPYTMDGVNHFANCPNAEQFRKPKPVQQSLLDVTQTAEAYPD